MTVKELIEQLETKPPTYVVKCLGLKGSLVIEAVTDHEDGSVKLW